MPRSAHGRCGAENVRCLLPEHGVSTAVADGVGDHHAVAEHGKAVKRHGIVVRTGADGVVAQGTFLPAQAGQGARHGAVVRDGQLARVAAPAAGQKGLCVAVVAHDDLIGVGKADELHELLRGLRVGHAGRERELAQTVAQVRVGEKQALVAVGILARGEHGVVGQRGLIVLRAVGVGGRGVDLRQTLGLHGVEHAAVGRKIGVGVFFVQVVNIHECLRVLPGLIEPAGADDLRAQVVVPSGKELDVAPQRLGGVKLEVADRVLDAAVHGGVLRGDDGKPRADGDEHDDDADEQRAQALVPPDLFVQDRPPALRAAARALRQLRMTFAALHVLFPPRDGRAFFDAKPAQRSL